MFMIEAQVVNVSKGGISIECLEEFEKGKVYTVKIFWRGIVVNAKCEVVWTLNGGIGRKHRSGMKFLEMDEVNEVNDFVACLDEYMADTDKRLHPRMNLERTRAVLIAL